MEELPIGEVARRAGIRTSALRYYRERGEKAPVIHAGDESPLPREREGRKKPAF
jgi:MerR-like DNA binding protein